MSRPVLMTEISAPIPVETGLIGGDTNRLFGLTRINVKMMKRHNVKNMNVLRIFISLVLRFSTTLASLQPFANKTETGAVLVTSDRPI
ncbi:MAG: hypothetical protein ACI4V2_06825 [Alloprevotella sp.]